MVSPSSVSNAHLLIYFYVLHKHLCPVFKVLAMTVQGSYPIFLGLAARKIGGQHLVKAGQEISLWAVGSVLIVNGLWNAGLFGLHIQDLLGKQDVENAQYFQRTIEFLNTHISNFLSLS
jgi:hypothetical protein